MENRIPDSLISFRLCNLASDYEIIVEHVIYNLIINYVILFYIM